jgi:hypothetical protein
MTMSRELHLVFRYEVEACSVDFKAFEKGLTVLVEVSSTNEEQLIERSKHCLEIVWEVIASGCSSFCESLRLNFIFVDVLGVALENKERFDESAYKVIGLRGFYNLLFFI